MSLTPADQRVLDEVQKQGKATIESVATALGVARGTVQRNLRFLREAGYIHLVEKQKKINSVLVFAYGEGEKVQRKEWQLRQDANRKIRRNTYDPDAPIVENTGWVSTIHSKDYSFQHSDHIKFMERFKPHPDAASAWLFKEAI